MKVPGHVEVRLKALVANQGPEGVELFKWHFMDGKSFSPHEGLRFPVPNDFGALFKKHHEKPDPTAAMETYEIKPDMRVQLWDGFEPWVFLIGWNRYERTAVAWVMTPRKGD